MSEETEILLAILIFVLFMVCLPWDDRERL